MAIHLRINGHSGCSEERLTPATNQAAAVTCEGCKAYIEAEKSRILEEAAQAQEPEPLTQKEIGDFLQRLSVDEERGVLLMLLDRRFARSEKREDALAKGLEQLTERMDDLDNRYRRVG